MSRFVILSHQPGPRLQNQDVHADWMFEHRGSLLTWATPVPQSFDGHQQLLAFRLPNHRLHYLDYEGSIEGDRGSVKRLLFGSCQISFLNEEQLETAITWQIADQQPASAIVRLQRNRVLDEADREAWDLEFDFAR